jgi:ATP-dependent RNA circularization protein (DNA/RNA ligase family)
MTKSDMRKIAEQYVLKHKDYYNNVTKKDVKQAVEKVAKALEEVTQSGKELKARGRAA